MGKSKDKDQITGLRALFCRHYVAGGMKNATQAAIDAGYAKSHARIQASKMLADPKIKARIAKLTKEAVKRTETSADDILKFAHNALTFDMTELFKVSKDGQTLTLKKPIDELPDEVRLLIDGVKQTKYGVEITFVDKAKILDMTAKFHGMYTTNLNVKNSFEDMTDEELEAERQRLRDANDD